MAITDTNNLREKIYKLVDVFYKPTFKTFYVNSIDGKTCIKPTGVFVSLGMTTSKNVLEETKEILISSGYQATLAEISSKKVGDQFLNVLTNSNNPVQYKLSTNIDGIMNREKSIQELESLKRELINLKGKKGNKSLAENVSKLNELIDKLDNSSDGWKDHSIQKEKNDYQIYHQLVNYKKENNAEYRLGIFVKE